MIIRHTYQNIDWIDLENPTTQEVATLLAEYSLPKLVSEELSVQTPRSKVDRYDNCLYMILHFPVPHPNKHDLVVEQEIDFVIGKDFIITAHYDAVVPLSEFAKTFEQHVASVAEKKGAHTGYVLYFLLQGLYKELDTELEKINTTLRHIERTIFDERRDGIVEEISKTNRILIDFKQAIRFHREILASLETAGTEFFGEEFAYYLSAMKGEYNKAQATLDEHRNILRDLRETNDSLLASKTNDTVKTLTVMSFIMLPLTLTANVFGMNMNFVFIKSMSDFFVVIASMSLTGLIMIIFFHFKKWL